MFENQFPYRCKKQLSGFTLLEIMLVVLLMATASVGVMMTIPDSVTSNGDAQWQAQRFSTLVQLAEDEALISGLELGLVFDENSYQFAFFDYQKKKWLPAVNKLIEKKIELPDSLQISYALSGSLWEELEVEKQHKFIDDNDLVDIDGEEEVISLRPQVYVMSSGEVTPFSVQISGVGNSSGVQQVTVSVSMSGSITLSESP